MSQAGHSEACPDTLDPSPGKAISADSMIDGQPGRYLLESLRSYVEVENDSGGEKSRFRAITRINSYDGKELDKTQEIECFDMESPTKRVLNASLDGVFSIDRATGKIGQKIELTFMVNDAHSKPVETTQARLVDSSDDKDFKALVKEADATGQKYSLRELSDGRIELTLTTLSKQNNGVMTFQSVYRRE